MTAESKAIPPTVGTAAWTLPRRPCQATQSTNLLHPSPKPSRQASIAGHHRQRRTPGPDPVAPAAITRPQGEEAAPTTHPDHTRASHPTRPHPRKPPEQATKTEATMRVTAKPARSPDEADRSPARAQRSDYASMRDRSSVAADPEMN